MFSVMNTGTNLRPLCTAKVRPTISGMIVDRRDQVLSTFFDFCRCASSTFVMRCLSMKGPFLIERAMVLLEPYASALRLLATPFDDHAVGPLVLSGLEPLGQLAPGRAKVAAT